MLADDNLMLETIPNIANSVLEIRSFEKNLVLWHKILLF